MVNSLKGILERRDKKIKFFYFRNQFRKPIACLATRLVEVPTLGGTGMVLELGWSLCHKRDTFRKQKAQLIAMGRLGKIKTMLPVKNMDAHSIRAQALMAIISNKELPHTIQVAAKNAIQDIIDYQKRND